MKTITITTRVTDSKYDWFKIPRSSLSFQLSDKTARLVADELSNSMHSPFIVEGGEDFCYNVEIGTEEEGRLYHAIHL